jgi:formylglycine-generating enzyme required for sulfatase activity
MRLLKKSLFLLLACGLNAEYIEPQMVLIKHGSFMMGSKDGYSDEKPKKAKVYYDFYISKFEVTNREFVQHLNSDDVSLGASVVTKDMDKNSHFIKTSDGKYKVEEGYLDHPAVNMNQHAVSDYILKLRKATGKVYRYPTHKEWEYVAKCGSDTTKWSFGDDKNLLKEYAWYDENSGGTTHPVGQKKPNKCGVYDMYGNAFEYVNTPKEDGYQKTYLKGGSYLNGANATRSSFKYRHKGRFIKPDIGFRLVREK